MSEGISRPDSWRWTDTLNVGNALYWMGVGFPVLRERGLRISTLLSLLPGCGYHVTSHLQLLLLFLQYWDGPYPQLWAKINPSFWDCSYLGLCHNQKSNTHVLFLSTVTFWGRARAPWWHRTGRKAPGQVAVHRVEAMPLSYLSMAMIKHCSQG